MPSKEALALLLQLSYACKLPRNTACTAKDGQQPLSSVGNLSADLDTDACNKKRLASLQLLSLTG